jgi:uncharacterized protein
MPPNWIQMHPTGKKFFPLRPNPADFDIRDIARHLSMLCRYVGGVSKFYSVAEHCVRVSRRVEQLMVLDDAYPEDSGAVLYNAKWALLHDASEAYMGDMSRPVKHASVMSQYRALERQLQQELVKAFGLEETEPAIVKQVDIEMLGTEARQLKQPIHPDWHHDAPGGKLAEEIPGLVLGWDPTTAERVFLSRYEKLWGKR